MTKFVPHTEPDFDTTADGLSVAFRDRGGQHHALVTAQTNPITGGTELSGLIVSMGETPDDTNTADYPVGTLFVSEA